MLLKIAQTFNKQATTGMFIPGFMATYSHDNIVTVGHHKTRHIMPLLAAPKALKASSIIGTSENERTVEWIRVSGSDKYLAD